MDLRTFVAETLKQIVDGVADAKSYFAQSETGAQINPVVRSSTDKVGNPSPVEFDIALTVSQSSESSGSTTGEAKVGMISVFQAKVGAESRDKDGNERQEVSRVRFTVMLAQPADIQVAQAPPPRPAQPGGWMA